MFNITISFFLLSLALVCNGINRYEGNTTALSSKYPFHVALSTDPTYQYDLYWKIDLEKEIIQFAVNVSTTGWIGFGLSPNGQMPGSDVLIGWISDNGVGTISVHNYLYILAYLYIRSSCHAFFNTFRIDMRCPELFQYQIKVKIGCLLVVE